MTDTFSITIDKRTLQTVKNQNDVHIHHISSTVFPPLPDHIFSFKIGKGKHAYDMLELFCGFDIETTNVSTSSGWKAAAYHMQVSLFTVREKHVYLFRKWDHVCAFFDYLADCYRLTPKRHMMILIANMGFEFQFLRRRLHWDEGEWDFFAKEIRQPLKATYRGIEFREVLTITGGNLAHLAKTYCKTQKLVGDLDYSIPRNSTTPLAPKEEAYCVNDVVILAEFSQYLFNIYIIPDHSIPMTFTSLLMREFKDDLEKRCEERDIKTKSDKKNSLRNWMAYMNQLQPDEATYQLWFKYLFRGGYVHGEALHADMDGLFALMFDITSHYPTRMNLDYFPVSPFQKVDALYHPSVEEIDRLCKDKCVIIHAVFDYVRSTTTHSIESSSKCVTLQGATLDNGRVHAADCMEVYLTEKDYAIYKKFYKWHNIVIIEAWTAKRGQLPPYILDVLNAHYRLKNDLKKRGLNDTMGYAIEKSRVNSGFGALIKRMRLERVTYTDDWGIGDVPLEYEKEAKKLITAPQWGIYVTSAARFEILTLLHRLVSAGVTVYYIDTDSIKCKASHKARKIVQHYNNSIKRHRHNRKLRSEFFSDLGELDKECKGKTVPFKYLGAKRYIYYYNGEIKATVAGMPKASVKQLGRSWQEVLKQFTSYGYRLDPELSGKITTSYTDEPYDVDIDGETMHELSGVALYSIPFTLNLTEDYKAHIEAQRLTQIREGAYL